MWAASMKMKARGWAKVLRTKAVSLMEEEEWADEAICFHAAHSVPRLHGDPSTLVSQYEGFGVIRAGESVFVPPGQSGFKWSLLPCSRSHCFKDSGFIFLIQVIDSDICTLLLGFLPLSDFLL